jgi:hypothetical protein
MQNVKNTAWQMEHLSRRQPSTLITTEGMVTVGKATSPSGGGGCS